MLVALEKCLRDSGMELTLWYSCGKWHAELRGHNGDIGFEAEDESMERAIAQVIASLKDFG